MSKGKGTFLRLAQLLAVSATLALSSTSQAQLYLNEIRINPPGADGDYRYIEIRGSGTIAASTYLVIFDSDGSNIGRADYLRNLGGETFGASGLLVICTGAGQLVPASTTRIIDSNLGGALSDSASVYLITTATAPTAGTDYDTGNDGTLDAPFTGVTPHDCVGWNDGNGTIYGGVTLGPTDGSWQPDAMTRFPGNNTARAASAWFYAELEAGSGGNRSLDFTQDTTRRSANFPTVSASEVFMTPGVPNEPNTASPIVLIGDPPKGIPPLAQIVAQSNPALGLTASGVTTITIETSDDTVAQPGTDLTAVYQSPYWWVTLNPRKAGFNVMVSLIPDSNRAQTRSFPYAALDSGGYGIFHGNGSDGSTALPAAGPVEENPGIFIIIGDDELNGIQLYNKNASSWPWFPFPLLDVTSGLGVTAEVDIEASVRVGDYNTYWIGGHENGPGPSFAARPDRNRFFYIELEEDPDSTPSLALGGHSRQLRTALQGLNPTRYRLQESMAAGIDSKQRYGFSIEGLAASPTSNSLYIGFRAPLVPAPTGGTIGPSEPSGRGTSALIAVLQNFEAISDAADDQTTPVFSGTYELDLGGRGIRSILATEGIDECDPEDDDGCPKYMILAGPPETTTTYTPGTFGLYLWDGNSTVWELNTDFAGRSPEALVEILLDPYHSSYDYGKVRVLEDNGSFDWYGTGGENKDFVFASFGHYRKTRSAVLRTGVTRSTPGFGWQVGTRGSQENTEAFGVGERNNDDGDIKLVGGGIDRTTAVPVRASVWQYFEDPHETDLTRLNSQAPPRVANAIYDPADYSAATIVGWSGYNLSTPRAVKWLFPVSGHPNGQIIDLGTLTGGTFAKSEARGVNLVGTSVRAVGWSEATYGIGAFYRDSTSGNTIQELARPSGNAYTVAHAINSKGDVVGTSGAASTGLRIACIWEYKNGQYGAPINLPQLASGQSSEAFAINENGTIVGYSRTSGGSKHAVMWYRIGPIMVIHDLGTDPSGSESEARGINNLGQVVGWATVSIPNIGPRQRGATWINGRYYHINAIMASGFTGAVLRLNSINDDGWMVGAWSNGSNDTPYFACYVQ